MIDQTAPRRLQRSLRRDETGTIAVIFALALVIPIGAAGLAVDYGNAGHVRSAMQVVLDGAALAAARGAMTGDESLQHYGDASVAANWHPGSTVRNALFNFAAGEDGAVVGTGSADVTTSFLSVFGVDHIRVSTTTRVELSNNKVEIALVLDNTGSMAGAKIADLQYAAKDLVEALMPNSGTNENVAIGVVPFARYVNVGLANRFESWISVPSDYSEDVNSCNTVTPVISKSGCTMVDATGYNDGVPYTYQYETCTDYEYGPPEEQCSTSTHTYVWNGCVGSRDSPLDKQDGGYGSPIPGLLNETCPRSLTPLTSDRTVIMDEIDLMSAGGSTYIPAGLMWGWRLLSSQAPFEQAQSYDLATQKGTQKTLILMSDGENTASSTYPWHTGSDDFEADNLTLEICTAIKARGIEIFAIAFDVTDAATISMLTACATQPPNFYEAVTASELTEAFRDIASKLSKLRIAG